MEEAEDTLDHIQQTRSWRFTAPFRYGEAALWRLLGFRKPHILAELRQQFFVGLINPLPSTLRIGKGNSLLVVGWYAHRTSAVRSLSLQAGMVSVPITHFFAATPRIPRNWYAHKLERNGFWCILPLPPGTHGSVALEVHATFANGEDDVQQLGTVQCNEESVEPLEPGKERIAICMATYNPDLLLFAKQIASLRRQTRTDWRCIIQDDASDHEVYQKMQRALEGDDRFVLFRNEQNLGFYHNFERCLGRVPATASFVALCDQDDEWDPEKLARCIEAFTPDTTLVYSDMRIATADGTVISETFWRDRKNNASEFPTLLLANSITGAASVFRRSLLESAVPFPPALPYSFHDWWIACAAMLAGTIRYLDTPLYTYVQHDGNVLGFEPGRERRSMRQRIRSFVPHHRWSYFNTLLHHALTASVLRQRMINIPRRTDALLARMASGGLLSLWLKAISATLRGLHTEKGSRRIALGVMVMKLCDVVFLLRRFVHAPARELTAGGPGSAVSPLLSVVVPLYHSDPQFLGPAIESVFAQTYKKWELVLVHDGPMPEALREFLASYERRHPQKLRIAALSAHGGISATTNHAASLARGEYLCFLDHDDLLEHDALSRLVETIGMRFGPVDAAYTDDDKIDAEGRRFAAQRKPDWNPELLLSSCYIGHMKVVRRTLFLDLGGFLSAFDGAQDYEFFLRLSERTHNIVHIPHVLYHWRSIPGSTAFDADAKPGSIERGREAVEAAVRRRGIHASVEIPPHALASRIGVYRLRFDAQSQQPTRRYAHDHPHFAPPGKRILLFTHTLNREGAPFSLFHLAKGLRHRGYDVTVFSPCDGPLRLLYRQHDIPLVVAPRHTEQRFQELLLRYDAVFLNTILAYRFFPRAHGKNIRILWCIRESEREKYFQQHPQLTTAHFYRADRVIFVSQATRERYGDLDHGNFATIPNSVDLEEIDRYIASHTRAETRQKLQLGEKDIAITLVGTVCQRKGQLALVQVIDQLRRIFPTLSLRCFLVGSGDGSPYEQTVEAFIAQKGLQSVVQLVPTTSDVLAYYHAADLFVCNSSIESAPRVILEAMAFSLPIVSTDVYGIPEQVRANQEALLIPPRDTPALQGALQELVQNPTLRAGLGLNARARVASAFTMETMIDRYENLLDVVCVA